MLAFLALIFLVVLLILGCVLLTRSDPRELVPGAWESGAPVLAVKAVVCAILRPQGVLSDEWKVESELEGRKGVHGKVKLSKEKLQALSIFQRKWRVDPDVYVKYYNVCGYDVKHDDDSSLQTPSEPYCFLETSFLKPLVTLVVSPAFPLSPLALIHIRQSITAYVTMRAVFSSTCDLYCGVSEMRVTVKGIEVDFKFSIQSQDGEVLAKGVSTVLSRNQITRKSFKERGNRDSQPFSGEKDKFSVNELHVPADTGLRYAGASGDYSPHHLYPWTARLLGYSKPMAHGMWTLSRAVATIQEAHGQSLSVPLKITGSFKRPLYLPSEAVVLYTEPDNNQVEFEVRDQSRRILHLEGSITCL